MKFISHPINVVSYSSCPLYELAKFPIVTGRVEEEDCCWGA